MISKKTFNELYQIIDETNWNALPSFFDENIVYTRPGFEDIVGLDSLINFYAHIRQVNGKHIVTSVLSEVPNWIVLGEFSGLNKNGQKVEVTYCDYFKSKESKFIFRQTFFHVPYI